MMSKEDEESFEAGLSKVDEVMGILSLMTSGDKTKEQMGVAFADQFLGTDNRSKQMEQTNVENFIVRVNQERTVINRQADEPSLEQPMTQDKYAFMAEIERDAARRAAERREREQVAQGLRRSGNRAFRRGEYEKAINMYSKAIDQIRDSPILYNNRALAYIRIGLPKRAIIDCDFVLSKLDEKNLRSWIFRAQGYYALAETKAYEKSVAEARKHNPRELGYIDRIVREIEGKVGTAVLAEMGAGDHQTAEDEQAVRDGSPSGGAIGDGLDVGVRGFDRALPMDDVQSTSSGEHSES
ncbi:tetratricopeptide repeat protein 12 [Anopheles ziemanni]|uniref:tetratricopeptide repeat protein 12 n=1 Tax=Anopheles coustani TaxID=139045 RepID=UPI00265967B2|nr:tetratricopeptide repeat protein 12 [Anopheles coustani]XP_058168343.1 tetratricopeptide repeat protein 12 [Anopheles ziemanni]